MDADEWVVESVQEADDEEEKAGVETAPATSDEPSALLADLAQQRSPGSSKKGRRLSIRNPRTGEKLALEEELPATVSSVASPDGKKSSKGRRLSIRDPSSGSKLDLSNVASPSIEVQTTPTRSINRRLSIRDPSSGKKLTLETDVGSGRQGLVIVDPNTGERVSLSPFRKAKTATQQKQQGQAPLESQRRVLDILDPSTGQSVMMSPSMAARQKERLQQAEQQYQLQWQQQQTWNTQQQHAQWHQPQQQYTQCAQPNAASMYAPPTENRENTPSMNAAMYTQNSKPAARGQIQWSFMK
jgi:hypothetical protein